MEPYITAIPKLMKMYMYSLAARSDRQLPANNTIQSHFKHNSESNIVPTAGAFGTFACQVWKGISGF
jgi:hypothetical protein